MQSAFGKRCKRCKRLHVKRTSGNTFTCKRLPKAFSIGMRPNSFVTAACFCRPAKLPSLTSGAGPISQHSSIPEQTAAVTRTFAAFYFLCMYLLSLRATVFNKIITLRAS